MKTRRADWIGTIIDRSLGVLAAILRLLLVDSLLDLTKVGLAAGGSVWTWAIIAYYAVPVVLLGRVMVEDVPPRRAAALSDQLL